MGNRQKNEVTIELTRKRARIRHPGLVALFAVLTWPWYPWFWWYFINREMADLGKGRRTHLLGEDPTVSTLAYSLGMFVVVPFIWTQVTTVRRIKNAQRLTGCTNLINGWVYAALSVCTFGIGGLVYMQSELNKVWHAPGMRPLVDTGPAGALETGDAARLAKLDELGSTGQLDQGGLEAERARLGLDPANAR